VVAPRGACGLLDPYAGTATSARCRPGADARCAVASAGLVLVVL
jgi:hypothetical protein